ncbi:uncharacterized protein [Drosophila bipectinata]|uniref:uncharacterized protein n=1 Tax=Drosophila bipectinata TaxID=42026 RepID=UPI001C8A9029|nr:uncharacterized protein LOC108122994 [Drosophila bipectinata]
MRLHLAIFLGLTLFRATYGSAACSTKCNEAFKGHLVCAHINACYLEMEYCSMIAFNCVHMVQHRPFFLVVGEGKCHDDQTPKCESMEY